MPFPKQYLFVVLFLVGIVIGTHIVYHYLCDNTSDYKFRLFYLHLMMLYEFMTLLFPQIEIPFPTDPIL